MGIKGLLCKALSARPKNARSAFSYEPLDPSIDSIRLIVLHPPQKGENSKVVRCHLVHTTFRAKPNYDALSYTWGEPEHSQTIFLNDKEVLVRENLYSALFYLRREQDKNLWADAIRIDQNNIEERSHQVRMMNYVYIREVRVLVWLGLPPPHIRQAGPEMEHNCALYRLTEPRSTGCVEFWADPCILSHPYWSRLWVVQEIVLGSLVEVYCCDTFIEWTHFISLLKRAQFCSQCCCVLGDSLNCCINPSCPLRHKQCMRYYTRIIPDSIKTLHQRRLSRYEESNRLECLLETFQFAQCQERRDRIYGLLGLAHDCPVGALEPDYTNSLFELYFNVIFSFYTKTSHHNGDSSRDRAMRVLSFSQLVQKLLGSKIMPIQIQTQATKADHVYHALAAILGKVLHVGPSYDDMISSRNADRTWRASFEEYYTVPEDLKTLNQYNDAYRHYLIHMQDGDTDKYCAFNPQFAHSQAVIIDESWNNSEEDWSQQALPGNIGASFADSNSAESAPTISSGPRIFLAEHLFM